MSMMYSRRLLFGAVLLGPLSVSAFEGLVDYQMTSGEKKPVSMSYKVKGDKIRAEFPSEKGRSGAMIMDSGSRTIWILSPEQRMAMKQTMAEPKSPEAKAGAAPRVEFKKTSRKETIAGRECTVYTFKETHSEGEVCNAEGLGNFMFSGFGGGKREASGWEREIMGKGLFPLRVMSKNLKDGNTTTLLATRVETKSLPASDFAIPSGYNVMDMGGLAGLGAAGKPSPVKGNPAPGYNPQEMMKKMMNASPAEREKMAEEMQKQYGQ
jgi:hypothetical protein